MTDSFRRLQQGGHALQMWISVSVSMRSCICRHPTSLPLSSFQGPGAFLHRSAQLLRLKEVQAGGLSSAELMEKRVGVVGGKGGFLRVPPRQG